MARVTVEDCVDKVPKPFRPGSDLGLPRPPALRRRRAAGRSRPRQEPRRGAARDRRQGSEARRDQGGVHQVPPEARRCRRAGGGASRRRRPARRPRHSAPSPRKSCCAPSHPRPSAAPSPSRSRKRTTKSSSRRLAWIGKAGARVPAFSFFGAPAGRPASVPPWRACREREQRRVFPGIASNAPATRPGACGRRPSFLPRQNLRKVARIFIWKYEQSVLKQMK